jgi:hypothetical protein
MRHESFMTSEGYYVATHILTVWQHLAGLAPDQPHSWSFPDAYSSGAFHNMYYTVSTGSSTG